MGGEGGAGLCGGGGAGGGGGGGVEGKALQRPQTCFGELKKQSFQLTPGDSQNPRSYTLKPHHTLILTSAFRQLVFAARSGRFCTYIAVTVLPFPVTRF